MDPIWWALAGALILTGLAGAVVPALPGVPLLFGGLWLVAGIDGYRHVGRSWVALIALVGAVGLVLDFAAGALGAKRVSASPAAVWGALIGTLIGIFLGLPGLLLGPFLGAMIGEWSAGKGVLRSAHVGASAWLGVMAGLVVKLVCSLWMVALFGASWWWNRGS